jgi:hypothetical protein
MRRVEHVTRMAEKSSAQSVLVGAPANMRPLRIPKRT